MTLKVNNPSFNVIKLSICNFQRIFNEFVFQLKFHIKCVCKLLDTMLFEI